MNGEKIRERLVILRKHFELMYVYRTDTLLGFLLLYRTKTVNCREGVML